MSQTNVVERKRERVYAAVGTVSMAKQSEAASCDINLIMGRYLRSGTVDHLTKHGGQYGFVSASTFHESMEIVRKAQEMFAELPASTRKRLGNSPQNFLEFVQDKDNLEEMVKLGLAVEKPGVAVARAAAAKAAAAERKAPEEPISGEPEGAEPPQRRRGPARATQGQP